jgi:hypothetical protein
VKYIFYFFLLGLLYALPLAAQTATDSTSPPETLKIDTVKKRTVKKIPALSKPVARDTNKTQPLISKPVIKDSNVKPTQIAAPVTLQKPDTGASVYTKILLLNKGFNFFAKPVSNLVEQRKPIGKEALFYLLAGLLLYFSLIRILFNKYLTNLMGLVFRGSLKQKQIREQLLQTPLPSLLLNIYFVMISGLYLVFLMQHFQLASNRGFWTLLVYCTMATGVVYLTKFLVLKFTGWIFNMREAADTYIFIVFLVNKLLGVFLMPVLLLLAFSPANWNGVIITLSLVMVFISFAYRYLISFAPVRREVKVSQFHFFMYLCAFEIIPLLLIYKVLLRFL